MIHCIAILLGEAILHVAGEVGDRHRNIFSRCVAVVAMVFARRPLDELLDPFVVEAGRADEHILVPQTSCIVVIFNQVVLRVTHSLPHLNALDSSVDMLLYRPHFSLQILENSIPSSPKLAHEGSVKEKEAHNERSRNAIEGVHKLGTAWC